MFIFIGTRITENYLMIRSNFKSALSLLTLLSIVFSTYAQDDGAMSDTLKVKKKTSTISVTNLFNTGSMYYFTGVVSNNKPSFDTKFVYDNLRNNWGVLFFKSFDLIDRNEAINYSLIVLNKRYFIGSRIIISPQAGTQLNQIGTIVSQVHIFRLFFPKLSAAYNYHDLKYVYQFGTKVLLITSYFKTGPWEEYKLDRYMVLKGWALYYSRSQKTPQH